MARLLNETQEKSVIEMYQDGMEIKNIAVKLNCSTHCIFDTLHRANISTKRRYPTDNLDINKVMELYNHGIGVAGVAEKLGYTRTQMIGYFKRNNIYMRSASEQQIERMKYSTPEQIAHLVEAAHKATKGRVSTEEERIKFALSKYKNGKTKSVYEELLATELKRQNIDFEYQYPIYYYNVDFVIKGVVVEIFGGYWHLYGRHKEIFPTRTKCILQNGYPILFVFASDKELFLNMIKETILPCVEEMSNKNLFKGKYRVLRSHGKVMINGDINSIDNFFETVAHIKRKDIKVCC